MLTKAELWNRYMRDAVKGGGLKSYQTETLIDKIDKLVAAYEKRFGKFPEQ